MDSPHYRPRLGFWIASTFVISVTVFAIILRGAGPGNGGGHAADLWLTVGLAILPGSFVGLLQSLAMNHPSLWAHVRWFCITSASSAVGWCIVFALWALFDRMQLLPAITNEIFSAIRDGLLTGTLMGMIIGLITGLIHGYIQTSLTREWLLGNILSWSFGVGVPLAVLFGIISQVSFFF